MILIIDEERTTRALKLRDEIESRGIPAVFVTSDSIRKYPAFTAAVVFASAEDKLNLVSVRLGKCLLMCINNSGSRIYNKDVVFYDESVGTVADFVMMVLRVKLDIDPENLRAGKLLLSGKYVTAELASVKLTTTERKILVLAMILQGKIFDENTVLKSCFGDGRSKSDKVSVHICNLNKKARRAFGVPIIICKRGQGYTLNTNL